MRPTEKIDELFKRSKVTVSDAADKKMIGDALTAIKQQDSLAEVEPSSWRIIMKSKFTKLAVAAVIIIGVLAGMNQFGGSIDGSSVAWADVVEQFRSMSFYNAVLYFKEDAATDPKQIELWVSSDHKARIRIDSQVLFADKGKVLVGYNFKDKRTLDELEYNEMAEAIIQKLCQQQQLSLNNVVQMVCKGKLQEVTPNINSDAMISEDMLVFDLDSTISPEWMRIWALRESKLPVRLRMWDPRDGECMDVFVTYEKQQPAEFFDHQKYEQLLKESYRGGGSVTNLAYALLKDPGGRDYSPQDLFNKSGYHLPTLEQVGITEFGAVWVMSSNSRNKTPEGHSFSGFSGLSDELGTDYRSISLGNLQIYLQKDYPFGKARPSKLTFESRTEIHYPHLKPELIGSVTVTDIKNAAWPKNAIRNIYTESNVMLRIAEWYCQEHRFEMCERIIEIVHKTNDGERLQEQIEGLRTKMFMAQDKRVEASKLALDLWPEAYEKYKNTSRTSPTPYDLVEYIVAVAYAGEIDKAAQLWKQVKETKHNLEGTKAFKRYVAEDMKKYIPRAERGLSIDMARQGISLEDISTVIGRDVRDNSELKGQIEQAERNKQYAKMKADANVYLAKMSEYYDNHPLPEKMELVERKVNKKVYLPYGNQLPGHEGYVVQPINSSLRNLASILPHVQGVYPSDKVSYLISDEVSEKLLDKEILADVVRRSNVSLSDTFEFALNHYGFEVEVEDGKSRKVWVARYNGMPLDNYKNVHVPFKNLTGTVIGAKPGTEGSSSSRGMKFDAHLTQLVFTQNKGVEDENTQKIFVNETGIEQPISMETAHWPGDEGFELARKWFEEKFGITFTEEVRPMPILIVQVKKQASKSYPVKGYLSREEMCEYYLANPLEPGQVAYHSGLFKNGLSITYSPPAKGLEDYKIMQVGTNVLHFAQMYHHTPYGRFRFSEDDKDIFVQFDIVYRKDVTTQKIVELTLEKMGLELIETKDDCTVWIAEHKGQELKGWDTIQCPIPNTKKVLDGTSGPPGSLSSMGVFKVSDLLRHLAKHQDMIVENNTGIDKEKYISGVIPNFKESKGIELAETWYKDNFGITFRKETRRMPVWIVRKKP